MKSSCAICRRCVANFEDCTQTRLLPLCHNQNKLINSRNKRKLTSEEQSLPRPLNEPGVGGQFSRYGGLVEVRGQPRGLHADEVASDAVDDRLEHLVATVTVHGLVEDYATDAGENGERFYDNVHVSII